VTLYLPDWVIARVTELKPDGEHGPFAFAEVIKSHDNWLEQGESLTFDYSDSTVQSVALRKEECAYKCAKPPRPGQIVVLGEIELNTEGFRAGFAVSYGKQHHSLPDVSLTLQERNQLKRKSVQTRLSA
jgi:hypothetical protein